MVDSLHSPYRTYIIGLYTFFTLPYPQSYLFIPLAVWKKTIRFKPFYMKIQVQYTHANSWHQRVRGPIVVAVAKLNTRSIAILFTTWNCQTTLCWLHSNVTLHSKQWWSKWNSLRFNWYITNFSNLLSLPLNLQFPCQYYQSKL